MADSNQAQPQSGDSGIAALAASVMGFQSTYENMATTMLRTQQMVYSMNEILERFLLNSLVAQLKVQPAQCVGPHMQARVSVVLTNTGAVEATDVFMEPELVHPATQARVEGTLYSIVGGADGERDSVALKRDRLLPGESWRVELGLCTPELAQYNLRVRTGLSSPSTGQPLSSLGECGVGVLDQVSAEFLPSAAAGCTTSATGTVAQTATSSEARTDGADGREGEGAAAGEKYSVHAGTVRRRFHVPPTAGLGPGCTLVASTQEGTLLALRVIDSMSPAAADHVVVTPVLGSNVAASSAAALQKCILSELDAIAVA